MGPWREAEGVLSLRLTHTGELRPCMDRADLGFPLLPLLRSQGPAGVEAVLRRFIAPPSTLAVAGHTPDQLPELRLSDGPGSGL